MSQFQNLPKGMLEQLHSLQQQLHSAQLELKGITITGSAGGGLVQVTLSGDQRCTQVRVSPELLKMEQQPMLQDLLVQAVNNALDNWRDLIEDGGTPVTTSAPGEGSSGSTTE